MPNPFNYSLNLPSPMQAMNNAIANAQGMQQYKHNEVLQKQQVKDRALAQRQAAEQAKAQKAMQDEMTALAGNPTTSGITSLMVKYPQLADKYKQVHAALSEDEKQSRIDQASKVYSALDAGSPSVAKKLLQHDVEAFKNTGQEKEAKELSDIIQIIDLNPNSAKTMAGMFLSSAMGDKFAETFGELQENERQNEIQPLEVQQAEIDIDKTRSEADRAEADARKAQTEANFAKQNILTDLKEKKWNIAAIQNDIGVKNQETRIKVLEAQLKKEENALKRKEIEQRMKDATADRDNALRQKTVEIESARTSIDNSVGVIDRLLQNPELDNVLGSVEGSAFYPSRTAGMLNPFADGDVRSDALADIENIKSQQFINNLMDVKAQGATFGSLTEKEGERLVSYGRNLATTQSEKQFRANLKKIQELLIKSRKNITTKYGVPETVPDTPEVEPTPDEVQNILKMYGVN